MKNRWIQNVNLKKGALSRQLGIPEKDNIPTRLLLKIKSTPLGKTIKNPTMKGKRLIPVTRLLKERVDFALNVQRKKR